MRWLLIALIAGCGGPSTAWDHWYGCNMCPGGNNGYSTTCDGGACSPGATETAITIDCLCLSPDGGAHPYTTPSIPLPISQDACLSAYNDWKAFAAATCR